MADDLSPAVTPDPRGAFCDSSYENAPSWAICIPTLNRWDILQVNIRCLLAQSRIPKQVIIIDAGNATTQNCALLIPLLADKGIEFICEQAEVKSSAAQRNQALGHVTSDIVIFIDDDSLMFDTCAETMFQRFEAGTKGQVACISLQNIDKFPQASQSLASASQTSQVDAAIIERKKGGTTGRLSMLKRLEKLPIWRFFRRNLSDAQQLYPGRQRAVLARGKLA